MSRSRFFPPFSLTKKGETLTPLKSPSVLVGPKAFIDKAKWFRKCFGGGIRQCGGLAVAANYALDHHLPLLPGTHDLASHLAQALAQLGVRLLVPTETHMLWLDPSPLGFDIWVLVERAKLQGLRLGGSRLVIHIQTSGAAVQELIELVRELKEEFKEQRIGMTKEEGESNLRFSKGIWDGMPEPIKAKRMGVSYGGKK